MSKGFMTPADLSLVDLDGRQLAGQRRRTSEVLTHFGIMKRQPLAKACVHAHPPHATAFAIADVEIPRRLIPEAEVFLGQIGVARYHTPGTAAIADEVGEVGRTHQAVLMINHGVICWGSHVEEAYWKMENIDAYCRMVWIASGLGGNFRRITATQAQELLELRRKFGVPDLGPETASVDRTGLSPARPIAGGLGDADPQLEAVVRAVTAQVLRSWPQPRPPQPSASS